MVVQRTTSDSTISLSSESSASSCSSSARSVHFNENIDVKIVSTSPWLDAVCGYPEADACPTCPELLVFAKQLYHGVEVVIKKPSWMPHRGKPGLLFSEDGGTTVSWLETGGSLNVCKVPTRFLLEVSHVPNKKGVAALKLRYRAKSVGTQEHSVVFEQPKVPDYERFFKGMQALVSINTAYWG